MILKNPVVVSWRYMWIKHVIFFRCIWQWIWIFNKITNYHILINHFAYRGYKFSLKQMSCFHLLPFRFPTGQWRCVRIVLIFHKNSKLKSQVMILRLHVSLWIDDLVLYSYRKLNTLLRFMIDFVWKHSKTYHIDMILL